MKMKVKRTGYDIVVNIICLGLLVGILIYLGVTWSSIPEKIPGHYNGAGVIDRWGNKKELLIVPVISWIMYLGLTVVEKFPQTWNTGIQVTEENKEQVYRILKDLLATEKLLMVAIFSFITICSSLSRALPMWFLPVFLSLVFGSLIFFMIRLGKNKTDN